MLTHELVEAIDGRTGLAAAKSQLFDCVLLDFRLPDVDTFDLLAKLVAPEGGRQTVLMLTGESDQDVAVRLMRAGALDYLTKAEMTPSSLARAIRYANARRSAVTELEAAHREAEKKSLELDTLNQQKTLLFSIIAHDLRNPFQAILGLSSVLAQSGASKDAASIKRRAQGIHQAAEQAHGLMESLFAWADLQMNTLAVPLGAVDLDNTATEVVKGARETAADKGLTLEAKCAGITVHAHRDMLATVLRNLVSNAIKFTMPGGRITIEGHEVEGSVSIAVTDSGVGMPAGRVADLFQLDRRTTSNGTAGERGSGLGLLLCRDLVERLGGRIDAESEVGVGTTFHFALPAAHAST